MKISQLLVVLVAVSLVACEQKTSTDKVMTEQQEEKIIDFLKQRFQKVNDFLGEMQKGDKYNDKQKHVYSEIVNYVKMLDEEKKKLDTTEMRLKKDSKLVYLSEKLETLKKQVRLVQVKFHDLCECRGQNGCECDVGGEDVEQEKQGGDVDNKVEELKQELLDHLVHQKQALLDKIGKNSCNVNQTMN